MDNRNEITNGVQNIQYINMTYWEEELKAYKNELSYMICLSLLDCFVALPISSGGGATSALKRLINRQIVLKCASFQPNVLSVCFLIRKLSFMFEQFQS